MKSREVSQRFIERMDNFYNSHFSSDHYRTNMNNGWWRSIVLSSSLPHNLSLFAFPSNFLIMKQREWGLLKTRWGNESSLSLLCKAKLKHNTYISERQARVRRRVRRKEDVKSRKEKKSAVLWLIFCRKRLKAQKGWCRKTKKKRRNSWWDHENVRQEGSKAVHHFFVTREVSASRISSHFPFSGSLELYVCVFATQGTRYHNFCQDFMCVSSCESCQWIALSLTFFFFVTLAFFWTWKTRSSSSSHDHVFFREHTFDSCIQQPNLGTWISLMYSMLTAFDRDDVGDDDASLLSAHLLFVKRFITTWCNELSDISLYISLAFFIFSQILQTSSLS